MATHHPEGCKRAPGGHIRYGVGSEPDGVLGGIGFTAASRQVGPRDRWIGGSADARIAPLGRVIRTHRFWLLPSVRVAGRASQVLRQAAPRLCGIGPRLTGYNRWCDRRVSAPNIRVGVIGPPVGRVVPSEPPVAARGWPVRSGSNRGSRIGGKRSVKTPTVASVGQDHWRPVTVGPNENRVAVRIPMVGSGGGSITVKPCGDPGTYPDRTF